MRLDRLLGDVEVLDLRGDATVEVSAVSYDSRAVRPGALFCCVRGERTDGHQYARAATSAGAVALLCERALALDVTQVVVADVRTAMAHAAAAFHGHPSRQLEVVGVTGTNGKTTTTHLLQAVLEADGRRTGLIGTLSGARTTPLSVFPLFFSALGAISGPRRKSPALRRRANPGSGAPAEGRPYTAYAQSRDIRAVLPSGRYRFVPQTK